jgi:hypothetical protein
MRNDGFVFYLLAVHCQVNYGSKKAFILRAGVKNYLVPERVFCQYAKTSDLRFVSLKYRFKLIHTPPPVDSRFAGIACGEL